jgi:hypothetical protein
VSEVREKLRRGKGEKIYIYLASGSGSVLSALTSLVDTKFTIRFYTSLFLNIALIKHFSKWLTLVLIYQTKHTFRGGLRV